MSNCFKVCALVAGLLLATPGVAAVSVALGCDIRSPTRAPYLCTPVSASDPVAITALLTASPAGFASSYAEAYARAGYGDLGVRTVTTAKPGYGTPPTPGEQIQVQSNARATARDVLEVHGIAPIGTPTRIRLDAWSSFHMLLTSGAAGPEPDDFTLNWHAKLDFDIKVSRADGGGNPVATLGTMHGTADLVRPYSEMTGEIHDFSFFEVVVGNNILVEMTLTSSAIFDAQDNPPRYNDITVWLTNDATNSLHLYASAVDAGVSLVSFSGHDYTAPVPEPAPVFLGSAGLILLMLRRRQINKAGIKRPSHASARLQ